MGSLKGVTAAGGVLWRAGRHGTEVLLVHRPRQDDWSLPKGKADSGEHLLQTAVREVTEETGLPFSIGPRLGMVSYTVKGRPKQVTYWAMPLDAKSDAEVQPHDPTEIDLARWFPLTEAHAQLTYTGDRQILDRFRARGRAELSLLLVRHALAGSRKSWRGPDELRPLEAQGIVDASAIGTIGAMFAPRRLLCAPLTRCVQTAQPLAAATGVPIEESPDVSDAGWRADPDRISSMIANLALTPGAVALVSQGEVIGAALQRLLGTHSEDYPRRKGSVWAFFVHDGQLAAADYYPGLSVTA